MGAQAGFQIAPPAPQQPDGGLGLGGQIAYPIANPGAVASAAAGLADATRAVRNPNMDEQRKETVCAWLKDNWKYLISSGALGAAGTMCFSAAIQAEGEHQAGSLLGGSLAMWAWAACEWSGMGFVKCCGQLREEPEPANLEYPQGSGDTGDGVVYQGGNGQGGFLGALRQYADGGVAQNGPMSSTGQKYGLGVGGNSGDGVYNWNTPGGLGVGNGNIGKDRTIDGLNSILLNKPSDATILQGADDFFMHNGSKVTQQGQGAICKDTPGVLSAELFADLPKGDYALRLIRGKRRQLPYSWLEIRTSGEGARRYLLDHWPGARRGPKWTSLWTLATQLDYRVKPIETKDRDEGHGGKLLFDCLSTDDESEGAIAQWNSTWHAETSRDFAAAEEMLAWKPPGGGAAPTWLVQEAQQPAMSDHKTGIRLRGRGWGNYWPWRKWNSNPDPKEDDDGAQKDGGKDGAKGKGKGKKGKGKKY